MVAAFFSTRQEENHQSDQHIKRQDWTWIIAKEIEGYMNIAWVAPNALLTPPTPTTVEETYTTSKAGPTMHSTRSGDPLIQCSLRRPQRSARSPSSQVNTQVSVHQPPLDFKHPSDPHHPRLRAATMVTSFLASCHSSPVPQCLISL